MEEQKGFFCTTYQEKNGWIKRSDPCGWSLWSQLLQCCCSAPGCFDPASTSHPKWAPGVYCNQVGLHHSSTLNTTGKVTLGHFSHWLSSFWLIGSAWEHENYTCCFVKIKRNKMLIKNSRPAERTGIVGPWRDEECKIMQWQHHSTEPSVATPTISQAEPTSAV